MTTEAPVYVLPRWFLATLAAAFLLASLGYTLHLIRVDCVKTVEAHNKASYIYNRRDPIKTCRWFGLFGLTTKMKKTEVIYLD